MKIVFFGDSITDANHIRDKECGLHVAYGGGYVNHVAAILTDESPRDYEIVNRGVSANRTTELLVRINEDVWKEKPDVLSVLIGVNDVLFEIMRQDGVDIDWFETNYRLIIEGTRKRLPDAKIMLCEPFILKGFATVERWDEWLEVKTYAKVVERLAKEYGLTFVPLQKTLDEASKRYGGDEYCSADGVHPTVAAAKRIAEHWVKIFKEKIK
ncbi:MAG: SGNH/GDSL hydrolase family protein [Clostridia bacterium]|nr:SGNH/GDSL hydrolase family protein [Clostridia bacterium]